MKRTPVGVLVGGLVATLGACASENKECEQVVSSSEEGVEPGVR